jgi:GNAT superfamily N-acetyltransferase
MMITTFRNYQHPDDYQKVSAFLIENFQPSNADGNWLEPTWEYMHGHPALEPQFLERIGVWEDAGEIVAVVNYETGLGEAFFHIKPGYENLRDEMLDYAEGNLTTEDGCLHAFVNDTNPAFTALVKERGYVHQPRGDRPLSRFGLPKDCPKIHLPKGFRLLSLADEPDWGKVHRVMYRGFNHPGDPEVNPENKAMRQKMFETATADLALKIVVAAPDGAFVSICGMFYQPQGRYGLVEPVATDPDYRRMGLGKAAVLEGIRRCAQRGTIEVFVGSNQPFYQALGFSVQYTSRCWEK